MYKEKLIKFYFDSAKINRRSDEQRKQWIHVFLKARQFVCNNANLLHQPIYLSKFCIVWNATFLLATDWNYIISLSNSKDQETCLQL